MKSCKTPRDAAPLRERLTLKSEGLTEVGSTRRYFPSVDRSSLFLALQKNSLVNILIYKTHRNEQGCEQKFTAGKSKIKKYSWEKIYILFWSIIAIYLSLGPHKLRQSYMRSLKEKNLHLKMKFINIFSIFVGNFFPPGSGSGLWI